jgi:hypothetical protein
MGPTVEQATIVADLLWPELVEEDGAVFLESARLAAAAPLNTFGNLIEAECFVNHLHVLDELEHRGSLATEPFWNTRHKDFRRAVRLAGRIAECWAARLATRCPESEFAVYATRDDNPIVRFHKVRAGSPLWHTPEELEALGPDAALMLLVRHGRIVSRYGRIAAAP